MGVGAGYKVVQTHTNGHRQIDPGEMMWYLLLGIQCRMLCDVPIVLHLINELVVGTSVESLAAAGLFASMAVQHMLNILQQRTLRLRSVYLCNDLCV